MKSLIEQFGSVFGAGVAAACCLGLPVVLTTLGAAGLGFLIHDAYLFPIFVGFISLSLWLLYKSAQRHNNLKPFWLALTAGVAASTALWFMVTGIYPLPWIIYASLFVLISGSLWDMSNGRKNNACTSEKCTTPEPSSEQPDPARRAITGAALSTSAAVAFYALYKSVDAFVDTAEAGEIACWGVNSCKGTTACSTAFNACTGQNECRGKGYINLPEKTCYLRGGVPLKGSEADPFRG